MVSIKSICKRICSWNLNRYILHFCQHTKEVKSFNKSSPWYVLGKILNDISNLQHFFLTRYTYMWVFIHCRYIPEQLLYCALVTRRWHIKLFALSFSRSQWGIRWFWSMTSLWCECVTVSNLFVWKICIMFRWVFT